MNLFDMTLVLSIIKKLFSRNFASMVNPRVHPLLCRLHIHNSIQILNYSVR